MTETAGYLTHHNYVGGRFRRLNVSMYHSNLCNLSERAGCVLLGYDTQVDTDMVCVRLHFHQIQLHGKGH